MSAHKSESMSESKSETMSAHKSASKSTNALSQARIENLVSYIASLLEGRDAREMYHKHEANFEGLQSLEIFRSFREILKRGYTEEQVIQVVPRVILATQTTAEDRHVLPDEPFLAELRAENQAMFETLDQVKPLLLEEPSEARDAAVRGHLEALKQMDSHFVRLQNIFFPTLEQKDEALHALSIFWAWQDEARDLLKAALAKWADKEASQQEQNSAIGKLFGLYATIPYKEEQFLYPAAEALLSEGDWSEMASQAKAYPTAFDVRREVSSDASVVAVAAGGGGVETGSLFRTLTGTLTHEQLNMILSRLPIDFTVVDEHDRVLYFSNSPERIFPRSPAIIGREVKNCHPPRSLAKVEEIISAFRAGREDHARFWITARGRKVLIEYFCLRDATGVYRGILEVSQDITEIQGLEGERRLAEWQ